MNPKQIVKKLHWKTQKQYSNNLEFLHKHHQKQLKQPFFTLYTGQIEILQHPIDFYINLHREIRQSNNRIILNTLYIGTGNLEKYLIEQINNKLKRSKKLKFTCLMDYFRGTRINRDKTSSIKLIQHLKSKNIHNQNIKLAFFANPYTNKFLSLQTESPFREIFGLHHMKYYIFDDNVIITGANLSEDYFTERQDRYYLLKNVKELADYLEDLASVVAGNSLQVEENNDMNTINQQPKHYEKKQFIKVFDHQFKMFLFSYFNKKKFGIKFEENFDFNGDKDYSNKFNIQNNTSQAANLNENQQNEKQTQDQKIDDESLNEFVPQFYQEQQEIIQMMEEKKDQAKTIEGDVANIVRRIESALYREDDENYDLVDLGGVVYLFPIIQIPCIKYKEDQILFEKFIDYNTQQSKNTIYFASGYMNLTQKLTDILIKSKNKINLLTASPQANGFYQAGRVKKWIPNFYRSYEISFLKQSFKNTKISLYEYYRSQWTFHSKGIWVYENEDELPSISVIGSSNYGYRSCDRDTEVQFYFYSQCPQFKKKLHQEVKHQFEHTNKVELESLQKDKDAKQGIFVKSWAKILKSFM